MNTLDDLADRIRLAWKGRGVVLKATSFALIGVVNTVIDAGVFFLGYMALGDTAPGSRLLAWIVQSCHCGGSSAVRLVAANILSWLVAVSASYVMNAFITFASESGRRLRWRHYASFVASGVFGGIANTIVLVAAAQAVPVWGAKALAILASFVVNFSLSHFVVFRPQAAGLSGVVPADPGPRPGESRDP